MSDVHCRVTRPQLLRVEPVETFLHFLTTQTQTQVTVDNERP